MKTEDFFHVLLVMAAVIALSRLLAPLLARLRQPSVIAQMVAGILLGPSLLGRISPQAVEFLLPDRAASGLKVVSQLGVLLYMFLVGLEFNTGVLKERGRTILGVVFGSMAAPFLLGLLLARPLFEAYSKPDASFGVFAMFIGVALSVTAFPVLARILAEHPVGKTHIGTTALAAAAVGDVAAWCLLALLVGLAQAKLGGGLATIGATAVFVAVMVVAVRPLIGRLIRRAEDRPLDQGTIALVFVALLASSLTAEWIGIHAIFGAFLLGTLIPHDSRIAQTFVQRMEDLVAVLLLPAFFALSGLRTELTLIGDLKGVWWAMVVVVAACLGKIGGSVVPARLTGMSWRDSLRLGALMNTRGLMELIILNVGLELGVLPPALFAIFVVMALATTFAAAPLLDRLSPAGERSTDYQWSRPPTPAPTSSTSSTGTAAASLNVDPEGSGIPSGQM